MILKKIKIFKNYSQLPEIPCEGAKIQQVFLNILRNRAQAMQEANTPSPEFIFKTSFHTNENMAIIEIEDNGPGMNEEIRKRAFEPFYTTKSMGKGTSLGLSVSYFIITENHGGKMEIESKIGKGTKFSIQIPLVKKNMMNNRKILIIDNEKSIRQSFIDYFEDKQWLVLEADNSEKALEIVANENPEFALVDIRLKGMNGDTFIKKAHQLNSSTLFIICTGSPGFITTSELANISQLSSKIVLKPDFDIGEIEKEILDLYSIQGEKNE